MERFADPGWLTHQKRHAPADTRFCHLSSCVQLFAGKAMRSYYKDDPYEAAREFSFVIFENASVAGFVGFLVSLVASAFLLEGKRRVYALVALVVAVIAVATYQGSGPSWIALILFLTLVSIVNHPTTERWVNWPLLLGAAILTASVVYMVAVRSTHPCS